MGKPRIRRAEKSCMAEVGEGKSGGAEIGEVSR